MAKAKKKSTTKPPPSLIVKAAKAAAAKAKEFKLDETSARKVAKKVADKTTKEIAKTTVDGYREVVRETMKQHAPRQLEIISRAGGTIAGETTAILEELSWSELTAAEREARTARLASKILKQQLVEGTDYSLRKARREAVKILKREAAKQIQASPAEQAKVIKQMLGLNRQRAGATIKLRARLIGEGLSRRRVDQRLALRIDRQLRSRAAAIARTQAAESNNALVRETYKQARRTGALKPNAYRRIIAVLDGKTCPICRQQAGRRYPMFTKAGKSASFRVGRTIRRGTVWGQRWTKGPPFHVNCRCVEVISLKA